MKTILLLLLITVSEATIGVFVKLTEWTKGRNMHRFTPVI